MRLASLGGAARLGGCRRCATGRAAPPTANAAARGTPHRRNRRSRVVAVVLCAALWITLGAVREAQGGPPATAQAKVSYNSAASVMATASYNATVSVDTAGK